jgi:hypothetical protein
MATPGFTIDVDHNEYLAEGDTVVDAIVTVSSHGEAGIATAGRLAQVIMIDCSGSMLGARIAEAKRATAAAIDALPDGVRFAVVAGSVTAQRVYPLRDSIAVADAQVRREAHRAVARLQAGGGTAMGNWLRLTRQLLADCDADIKRGLLLTDGYNQHESPEELQDALDACNGIFVCDACGIGDDWNATEVRLVADQLLGEGYGLPEPSQWTARFTELTAAAMRKTVGEAMLRVFTPARNRIRFLKQMNPTIVDLTDRRSELDHKTGDYPTGSWGAENREFHLSIEVPPIGVGDDRLAARVSVIAGDGELAKGLVTARWTGDSLLSTTLNPKVAHYTGQAELASAIQDGVAAAKAGDTTVATDRLGYALRLAHEAGNNGTARLLSKVVDLDPDTGTVRMKPQFDSIDLEMADVESVKTITVRRNREDGPSTGGPHENLPQ